MKLSNIIVSIVLCSLVAIAVFFSVIKASVGVTGSLMAAILGFLALSLIKRMGILSGFEPRDVNLIQTAASAAGSVAASSLFLAAFYLLDIEIPGWLLFAYLLFAGWLGVMLAIPLRAYFVCREQLPFPSGTACYELITALTGGREARRLGGWLGGAFVVGGLIKLGTVLNWIKGYFVAGGAAGKALLGLAIDPLLYGIGMIVGVRVGLTLLLSGLIVWFALVPILADSGIVPGTGYGEAKGFLVYPAIAWMLGSAFASLLFRTKRFEQDSPDLDTAQGESVWVISRNLWLVVVVLLSLAVLGILMVAGVSPVLSVVAVLSSLVFALVSIKALGATDMNPLSTLSNLMLFLQAKLGAPVPVLPSSATTVIASLGSDTMQDFRTGYLLKVEPRAQVWMQLLGVTLGAAVLTVLLHYLLGGNLIVLGSNEYPAATTVAVAELSRSLSGAVPLPPYAAAAALLGGVGGLLLGMVEAYRPSRFLPVGIAVGIAMILPLFYSAAITLGALAGHLMGRLGVNRSAVYATAAGLILADSLFGLAGLWPG